MNDIRLWILYVQYYWKQFCNISHPVYIFSAVLGFNVAFNTIQVISWWVVLWKEETSIYSWSRFYTVNCQPSVSKYQIFHISSGVWATDLRGGRWVCYHCATVTPWSALFSWISREQKTLLINQKSQLIVSMSIEKTFSVIWYLFLLNIEILIHQAIKSGIQMYFFHPVELLYFHTFLTLCNSIFLCSMK